ncbi:MAG: hypothetical protein ASARMPRED_007571 [Alectoria sarmentosa]|nr:MAG: hypothetical protein ASARMPRED_007571 [Alectoria sarmentosa]
MSAQLTSDAVLKACHKRCAERTLEVLEQNGSIFIKLGQHLSSMNYLLPEEWTTTFVPLQDHCPVSSYDSIAAMILNDTGLPLDEHFDHFTKTPIGAASLAQVHLAKMKGNGQNVAVKMQHPALEEWVPLDLFLTRTTFSIVKYFFPEYDLEWLSNEMESSLPLELDFALEGRNALRTKEYFSKMHDSPLVVPDVMWSSRRILVMENVPGHRTDDLGYLDSNGIDRDEVSAALAHIFNEMIFGDTPLHCDPHGGNIAIRKNDRRKPNFDIILYDHGLYRDIPKELRRDYAKLWLAVIDADENGMRKYAFDVAGINDDQFPLFASAITGRDYMTATNSVVSTRSDEEKQVISGAMGEGMLQELVQLLGKVPRIILLILKTNDLTRSLDENLHTRQVGKYTSVSMEAQVDRLVKKMWMKYKATPSSKRLLIAVSGIPGSGKTTLAKLVAEGLNAIHNEQAPGCASTPIATSVPMDGYHLSRAQLSAMPDPNTAHHRRGAAFTFDDKAFLELVKTLRITLLPESKIVYAPSFDHAIKDPVADDIPIHPASRIVIFEGNYLSLDQGLWKEAAELMDELWFVEVDFETARTRLLVRHVAAGIAKDEEEAGNRADEIDLVNGRQIVGQRLDVQEVITSKEDESWRPGGQRDPE